MRVEPRQRRSRQAFWSRRTALAGGVVLAAAIVAHRYGTIGADFALSLIAFGLALAAFALLSALSAFAVIWRQGRKGTGAAVQGLLLALVILAYPAALAVPLFSLPALSDVTTDIETPPAFSAVDWPHPVPQPNALAAQRLAYPDAVPRAYAVDAELVFNELAAIVADRGWDLRRAVPPEVILAPVAEAADDPPAAVPAEPDNGAAPAPPAPQETYRSGWIEAVAATPLLAFPEDVVIRVAPGPTGTVVDIRSASRHLAHDLGSNARRIAGIFEDLEGRLSLPAPGD